MGNKQCKILYELIEEAFNAEKTVANTLSTQYITEPEMIDHLYGLIAKKVKDTEIQTLEKELRLNIPAEETKEEREAKQKKMQQIKLQSTLVAGHEHLPEVKAIFQSSNLETNVSLARESVKVYSHKMITHLVSSMLILLEKSASKQEAASFYARVGNFLMPSQDAAIGMENSGTSTAVHFAALLIEPKKILTDPQLSANILDMFQTMSSLSFYGWTRQSLIIDRSIEYITSSLIKQLDDNLETLPSKGLEIIENAIKTLFFIGLARGSVEGLLIAIYFLVKTKLKFDVAEVLERILSLPSATEFLSSFSFSMQKKSLEYIIPFEQIYVEKTSWISERDAAFTSATNGEFLYFYTPSSGLMTLGIGRVKLKGKIYSRGFLLEAKGKIQLLTLKRKLYCWNEGKFYRVYPDTLKMKITKKGETLVIDSNMLLTSTEKMIVAYSKHPDVAGDSEGGEKVQGEVTFYDITAKRVVNKVQVTHSILDLQQFMVCGDLLIFTGKKKYEIIDYVRKATLKTEESEILKQSTFCVNSEKDEIFTVFFAGDTEGVCLGKFEALNIKQDSIHIIEERIAEGKKLLNIENKDKNSLQKKELASLLGILNVGPSTKQSESLLPNRIEFLLAALASRAKAAESVIRIMDVREPEELLKIYKTPVGVHLTGRCFDVQMKLVELFFTEAIEGKNRESTELAFEKLSYLITILNQHMLSLRKCNISLEECAGPTGSAMYSKICQNIMSPILKGEIFAKYSVTNTELITSLKKSCEECMKNSQALASPEIERAFVSLGEIMQKMLTEKKLDESFHGIISWLDTQDNIELLATKILEKNPECLKLLDLYYSIEEEYTHSTLQIFLKNDPKIINTFSSVLQELRGPFSLAIERMFVLIG